MKKIAIVFTLSVMGFSCGDNVLEKTPLEQSFGIQNIQMAENADIRAVSSFVHQYNLLNNTRINVLSPSEQVEVVTYDDLPGKSLVIDFPQESVRSDSEKTLIIVLNDEAEIIADLVHERIDQGSSFLMKTSLSGIELFSAEIDKKTEIFIKFTMNSVPNARDMTFAECIKVAASACAGDGECAFLCGVIWKYCLGAIVTACAVQAV